MAPPLPPSRAKASHGPGCAAVFAMHALNPREARPPPHSCMCPTLSCLCGLGLDLLPVTWPCPAHSRSLQGDLSQEVCPRLGGGCARTMPSPLCALYSLIMVTCVPSQAQCPARVGPLRAAAGQGDDHVPGTSRGNADLCTLVGELLPEGRRPPPSVASTLSPNLTLALLSSQAHLGTFLPQAAPPGAPCRNGRRC